VVRNILSHHGTGTDEGVGSNGVSADNSAVGSQGGAFFNENGADLVHFGDFRSRIVDVCEDHGGAAEDAIFQGNSFIGADIVLNLALVANSYVRANYDILADVAVLADLGAGEDMGEVPDLGAFADGHVVVHDGSGVDEDVRKKLR
jgi:hypothetical protein